MKQTFKPIIFNKIIITLIFVFCVGCSTQNDTAANRIYHQLNTKYNGLFYAEKYLEEGIKKVKSTHSDNYKRPLRINKYSDLSRAKSAQSTLDKAIEKSTLAIQHHSMEIDGEEKNKLIDNNYMVIAIAQFYKHDFASAINTFNFLVRKSKNENLRTEALIWTAKCHNEIKNKEATRKSIRTLEEDYDLTPEQYSALNQINAELAIQEGYYLEAKNFLSKGLEGVEEKETKIRIYYILGQIDLLLNNPKDALQNFNEVIKRNPEYEMVFNAKLMRAQSYIEGNSNFAQLSESLNKMIKDRKNIEYKDQIYYELASLQLKKPDTLSAINSLKLSTKSSLSNNNQKLSSHYLLSSLFWERQDYISAYNHCDTAFQLADKTHPEYKKIKQMLNSSKKIASKYNYINYNDSIIALARLPEEERIKFVDDHIDFLKQRDQQNQNLKDNPKGGAFNSYEFNRQSQNSMSISSGGGWYFYNPSAMSLGYSEFLSRWGNRKLEDNWRRKNKNDSFEQEGVEGDVFGKTPTEKEKYNRNFYLDQLPIKDEEQLMLLSKIESAYYELGVLFKEEVEDYQQSILVFNELIQRFPSTDYMPLIYFDLYGVYTLMGDSLSAQDYLEKIRHDYPDSNYLSILDGDLVDTKLNQDKETYKQAYKFYTEFTVNSCKRLRSLLSTNQENIFLPQMELLSAFCEAKRSNKKAFIDSLSIIKTKYPKNKISGKIDTIIMVLKGEFALNENDTYDSNLNSPHYFLLTIQNLNINLPEMQSSISRFNNTTHKLDSLEITNLLLTKSLQVLRVGQFKNSENAIAYYEFIKENDITKSTIENKDIQPLIISEGNYTKLLRRKNINEYIEHFNKIYLLN